MLAMLPLARCGVSDEELFTSGLNRVWLLSQAFYNFFSIICALTVFLMSYCSKLLKRLPGLPVGSLNSPWSGSRTQCGPTKAAADCWGAALLGCRSSLCAGSQECVSQGTRNQLPKAVMIQRLVHCHRGRNSAHNQQIKIPSLQLAK